MVREKEYGIFSQDARRLEKTCAVVYAVRQAKLNGAWTSPDGNLLPTPDTATTGRF